MGAIDSSLSDRVNQIVASEFELDAQSIRPDADLYNDLGLDSLDAIDLVVALERAFGFKVEEGAVRKIRTVGQLHDFVASRVL
ncbi:MAG: acyl carrier protein [Planctomycetes bacterium]|nr:acyl carrier protein [Planctomycetota bacterium]